jgi:hypothetical protein
MSALGLLMAIALLALGALALVGANFTEHNVSDRLAPQHISFPDRAALEKEGITDTGILKFGGQQVVDGFQAKAYADYIGHHLQAVNNGQTYSETSAASRANPSDTALAGKVQTLFRGETLRSILYNAYGWWFVAQVAWWAGIGLLVLGLVMLVLTVLGVRHLQRTPEEARI